MTQSSPQFSAALSTSESWQDATSEITNAVLQQVSDSVHLAFLFVSSHFKEDFAEIVAKVHQSIQCDNLISCTGESIIGNSQEIENQPAISLWVAHLPEVQLLPMHLEFLQNMDGGSFDGWNPNLPEQWPEDSALLMIGEPFSFPADAILARLNEDQPGIPVIGGMASGGHTPKENLIALGSQVFDSGAIAIHVQGAIRIHSLVSQGCRPIGKPLVITKCERNEIFELGGKPPLVQLQEIFDTLPVSDQKLVHQGLHVGRVIDEYRDQFEQGDFLIRNVVGVDEKAGAIVVADFMRPGQTVQFHIRDEKSADAELQELLGKLNQHLPHPAAALIFTCNGRGTRLFSEPHHDATCVASACGEIPAAGFFAMGELGPIGKKNFMHGFTASMAIFEATQNQPE
ncbi:MAG: FIST signal transduction protein [Pirellulales bacterium]